MKIFSLNSVLSGQKPTEVPGPEQQWADVCARAVAQAEDLERTPNTSFRLARWRAIVMRIARGEPVDDVFNREMNALVTYRPDAEFDEWATPLETLKCGLGDCEDYAILKLLALVAAGLDPAPYRLTLWRAINTQRSDHVSLAVPSGYLDNRVSRVLTDADYAGWFEQVAQLSYPAVPATATTSEGPPTT